jgi:hypothetical protein
MSRKNLRRPCLEVKETTIVLPKTMNTDTELKYNVNTVILHWLFKFYGGVMFDYSPGEILCSSNVLLQLVVCYPLVSICC